MLVGYSSSSEEENGADHGGEKDNGGPARKKPRTRGEVPKTR